MRRLILHMMTTADGCIADAEGKLGGWTNWDEEMKAFYNDEVFAAADTIMRKVVASTTMEHAGPGVIILRDNIASRIHELKANTGSDILLYCGPRLVSTLTELGLIDEYMLYVNPIVLGQGTQLFAEIKGPLGLMLLKTKTFGSGVVLKNYRPIYAT